MYSIRRTEDVDEVHELHTLAFPSDVWVGDEHTFWIAKDREGKPAGFCSAVLQPNDTVFLSRASVVVSARGAGLQRRMIRVRVAWARRIGVTRIITYTVRSNHESIANLLKCGFRFYTPEDKAWSSYHCFEFKL